MDPGITWYVILGALPGSSPEQIERAYQVKAGQLGPQVLAGATSAVLTAASRAQRMLDDARGVLGNPEQRRRYDEAIGVRRSGGGLASPVSVPSRPGLDIDDLFLLDSVPGAEALGAVLELTDWLLPGPRRPSRIAVPDVRGLFYSVCLDVVGRMDLRVKVVRLTAHPMPVDGLVVSQSPRPPARARSGSELTVQVWHPPARPR